MTSIRRLAALASVVSGLMIASYAAGRADASPTDAVAKLNQTHDLLAKARAVLGATQSNRLGYGNVEKAKASVDSALAEVEKAVKANGG